MTSSIAEGTQSFLQVKRKRRIADYITAFETSIYILELNIMLTNFCPTKKNAYKLLSDQKKYIKWYMK